MRATAASAPISSLTPVRRDVSSTTPFANDHENHSYDKEYVERFHHILVGVDDIFEEFRGRFCGKSTPVHFIRAVDAGEIA